MGFKTGIVGLPNVGKSTLFNALTEASIEAANYPFCTIEPNIGIVPVPDARLNQLANIIHPKQILPTTMKFVDIAGLVKGAAQGEGLGNQFLSHIRETDAIIHVVRCFENTDITHVTGQISPIDDIEIIHTELLLADLQTIEKALQKVRKNAKSANTEAIEEKKLLENISHHLNEGHSIRSFSLESLTEKQLTYLKQLQLLTAKPTLYAANIDEDGLENNPYLNAVIEYAAQENSEVIPVCAKIESELAELEASEKTEFLTELGWEEPGLNRIIRTGHQLLRLHTFFTAGPKEVRAWTIKEKTLAPQAAGVIHSDFEKGFIRAEVIAYENYIQYGGEQGSKEAGKWRLEGKDYIVQDGDVIHFRFNV